VEDHEVEALYSHEFTIEKKGTWDVTGPRGITVQETVYLMTRADL
jgi:hypothetical protein